MLDFHWAPISAPLLDVPPWGRGTERKCRAGAFFMAPDGPYPFCPFGTFPPDRGIGLGRRRGRARRVVAPHANDHCYLSCRAPEGRRVRDAAPHGRPVGKQREVALPPIRCTPPKIAHSHTFIGNCAPPCPFTNTSLPGLARSRDFRYIRSVDFLPLPADRTAGIIGGTLKKEGLYVGHHFESSPGQRRGETGI